VRGSGANTEIILPSRTGVLAIFTTTDGLSFTPTAVATDGPANAYLRGVAFGEGTTFWGTAENQPLYNVYFDLPGAIGFVEHAFQSAEIPLSIGPIGVDVANKLLAGLSIASPQTVSLYDISNLANGPALLQTINLPTSVANTLFAGALDFGGGKLFVLDTNNGITAYNLPGIARPELRITRNASGSVTISWPDSAEGYKLQRATNLTTPDWADTTDAQTVTDGQRSITVTALSGNAFFRLVK
jgi:hypothetical protein